MAVGNRTLPDASGATPDWIELYNPTDTDLDLGGYCLTDNPVDLQKWVFPSTLLPARGYLIVYASDKNHAEAGAELHTNFKLAAQGEYLALVAPDGVSVLSEFSPTFPAQEPGFSYGVGGPPENSLMGYFARPTPGAFNAWPLPAPLLPPVITPGNTTFTEAITVTMSTQSPESLILYTTSGLAQDVRSMRYTQPITLDASAVIQARVVSTVTGEQSVPAVATFAELATQSDLTGINPPATFTSDLPIMVVENYGAESIGGPGSSFRPARLLVFDVNEVTGRSSVAHTPDACFRIGIRRRGQSSSGFPKPQYRIELWDEEDIEIDYPLLGLPAESDWVLYGPYTDKALIRNPLAFSLGRSLGLAAPLTRHYEMFLSTDGGKLNSREYVGVYVLTESIKLSKNRSNLARLDSTDVTDPNISGGYMMRFEPPGIANDGPRATGWRSVEIIEPKIPSPEQEDWLGNYLDIIGHTLGWQRGTANNSGIPDSDPLFGYPAYIDVNSFVNLLVLNELLREQDSYVRSDYMFKDRDGKLHKGPLWDYNLIAGTGCCFDNRNTAGWQYEQDYNRGGRDHRYEPDWFVPLLRCPVFGQAFVDRWFELRNNGDLELERLFALIDNLADPLRESAQRNFTKWNILQRSSVGFPSPVSNTWAEQIDLIKTWLTSRMAWLDSQFPAQVRFSPETNTIEPGTEVILSADDGYIVYTTDGSDPRMPDGSINPNAVLLGADQVDGPVENTYISQLATNVEVLRPSDPLPGPSAWSAVAFDSSSWLIGSNGIGYENSPADYAQLINVDIGNAPSRRPHSVYVRFPFHIADAPNMNVLTLLIQYDDGFVAYLNGTRIAARNAPAGVPTWNSAATGTHDDSSAKVFEEIDVSTSVDLLVAGDNVLAVHVLNYGGSPNESNTGCSSSDMLCAVELAGSLVTPASGSLTVQASVKLFARSFRTGQWGPAALKTYVVDELSQ